MHWGFKVVSIVVLMKIHYQQSTYSEITWIVLVRCYLSYQLQ